MNSVASHTVCGRGVDAGRPVGSQASKLTLTSARRGPGAAGTGLLRAVPVGVVAAACEGAEDDWAGLEAGEPGTGVPFLGASVAAAGERRADASAFAFATAASVCNNGSQLTQTTTASMTAARAGTEVRKRCPNQDGRLRLTHVARCDVRTHRHDLLDTGDIMRSAASIPDADATARRHEVTPRQGPPRTGAIVCCVYHSCNIITVGTHIQDHHGLRAAWAPGGVRPQ